MRRLASPIDHRDRPDLAKFVRYLKTENRILRDRIPGQIHTRPAERARLLKFGQPLGKAINTLITVVTPGTFWRWIRDAETDYACDFFTQRVVDDVLYEEIDYLLTRPVGRPPKKPVIDFTCFEYRAATWTKPRRVAAKVERTNLSNSISCPITKVKHIFIG